MERIVGKGFTFDPVAGGRRSEPAADAAALANPVASRPPAARPEHAYRHGGRSGSSEISAGIVATAQAVGINPVDLATAISYETGGTFDPTKAGPVTKWGRHRGLIQFGEPQARKYGVDWNDPINSQLGPDGAIAKYLRDAGVRPGMGLLDVYSAINAGSVGKYSASDVAAGGAPGNVADKVRTMVPHRRKAAALLGGQVDDIETSSVSLDKESGDAALVAKRGPNGLPRIIVNTSTKLEPETMGAIPGIRPFDPLASYKIKKTETPVVETNNPLTRINADREARGMKPLITMPADKYEKWKQKFDAEQPGVLSDIGNLLVLGAQMPGHALREIIRALPGGDTIDARMSKIDEFIAGKPTEELFKEETQKYTERLSAPTQAARSKDWWDSENNRLGAAWTDPRAYMAGIVESIPGTVMTMGPSMLLARGTFMAAVAGGATREAASAAAAKTAFLAGGVGEGLLAGGSTSAQVREELSALPQDVWDNSQAYKALVEQGMSPDEAKASITSDSAAQAGLIAGVTTGLVGGRGDQVLAGILTKGLTGSVTKRIAKAAGKEAVAEAVEETVQSAGEQTAANIGVRNVDPNRPLTKGVASAALGGAVTGGLMGGGIGAAVAPFSAEAEETPPGGTTGTQPAAGTQTTPAGGAPPGGAPPPATAQEAGIAAGAGLPGRKVGPLERAIGHGETEAQAVVTQEAVKAGSPPPGTRVTVDDGEGGIVNGVIQGYSINGGVRVVDDEDKDVQEYPPEFVTPAIPAGTQEIELGPSEYGPAPTAPAQPTPEPSPAATVAPTPTAAGEAAAPAAAPAPVPTPAQGSAPAAAAQPQEAPPPAAEAKPGPRPAPVPAEPAKAEKAEKPAVREVTTREGEFKEVQFPGVFHAHLFELGEKRASVRSLKERETAATVEQQRLADKMKVSYADAGKIADDYRYRAQRAAEEGKKAKPVNPKMLARLQAEHAARQKPSPAVPPPSAGKTAAVSPIPESKAAAAFEPAGAEAAQPATAEAAVAAVAQTAAAPRRNMQEWWDDELTNPGRKRLLARAKIRRSAATMWKNLPVNLQSKIVDAMQELEREGTLPAGRVPAEAKAPAAPKPKAEAKPPASVAPPVSAKPTGRTISRDTSPDVSTSTTYKDLGIDNLQLTGHPGDAARDEVQRRGKASGIESLVMLDQHGDVVANGTGDPNSTGMTQRILAMMKDPREQLVMHHNHPSDQGFSRQDLAVARYPGILAVYAHTTDGISYRVEWKPAARMAFGALSTPETVRKMDAIFLPLKRAMGLYTDTTRMRGQKTLVPDMDREIGHVRAMAMRDAGMLDYGTEGRPDSPLLQIPAIKSAYDQAVSQFARTVGGGVAARTSGRAGVSRHPGEVSFFHQTDAKTPAQPAAQPGDQGRAGEPAAIPGKGGQGSLLTEVERLPGTTPHPGPTGAHRGRRVVWLDTFGNPLLVNPTGGKKGTVVKVIDVARAFDRAHKREVKKQIFPETSKADYRRMLDMAREEMRAQLPRENSGVGWYGTDVQAAVELTSQIFPTLATNQDHRDLYLTLAGLFSSGLDPDQAWQISSEAFAAYLATGELPVTREEAARATGRPVQMTTFKSDTTGEMVTQPAGWGKRSEGNEQQLALINHLIAREGSLRGAMDWFTKKHKRSDVNAAMTDSGLYKDGRYTTKAEVAGPDAYGFLTFGPKLGRYTLGLHGMPLTHLDTTIDLWFTRSFRRWTGRLFETPIGKEGIAAQPANDAERDVIMRMVGELMNEFNLTVGDVQAVLWFFEKRLWGAHGLSTEEGSNSTGARRLLRASGIDEGRGGSLPGGPSVAQASAGAPGRAGAESLQEEHLADIRETIGAVASRIANPREAHFKDRIKSAWTSFTPTMLSAVYLNYLPDLAPRVIKAHVEQYIKEKRKMDTLRNVIHREAEVHVQKWQKFAAKSGKVQAKNLATLMHDSRKAGVDPTNLSQNQDPAYADLRTRYMALPETGKELYNEVRDAYEKQSDALDALLVSNVRKAHEIAERQASRRHAEKLRDIQLNPNLTDQERQDQTDAANAAAAAARLKARGRTRYTVDQLRQKLESQRVKAPYFPLGRFGKHFVSVRDPNNILVHFALAENQFHAKQNQRAAEQEFPSAQGFTIESGKLPEKLNDAANPVVKPSFIADIEMMLPPGVDKDMIMDQIWQRYLRTSMPDLSIRSRKIHAKMIEGHSEDALRVFANHMFHAAHQMARLAHGLELGDIVDETKLLASNAVGDQQTKAVILADELSDRHKWVMNPGGKAWAQNLSTLAFSWYLAASPAAAMVNLAQTPMVGIPIIGARFGGMSKAAAAILRASKNAISDTGLSDTEKRALLDMEKSGLIDNTQSFDIQGVGEAGVTYNPVRAKIMGAMTYMFHKAEVVNRRVTALAAYRLAVQEGQSHTQAVATASDLTWKTHFDYSNSSRPRIMQSPIGKVLLAMRSYQINMLYRLASDLHKSFKGATPAERKEARTQFAGILGMQALVAGATGVAGYNTAFFLYGMMSSIWSAIFGGGDDEDDPFTTQEKFRESVLSLLGPYLGGIVLNGVAGTFTGVDLTSRLGMPDLWFRSPNKDLQTGQDTYLYYLTQIAGAPPAVFEQMARGYDYLAKGDPERAAEGFAPKVFKDLLKSNRMLWEGLQTPDGDVVMDNVGAWAIVAQAMGFTPANVAEQWDKQTTLKNAEKRVKVNRQAYINSFAMAVKTGDAAGREEALEKIRSFNKSQYGRTMPIKGSSLRSSIKHRAIAAGKRERGGGVYISNEALRQQLQLGVQATVQ